MNMDESQIGRVLSTGFSPHQIGYVATYIQPLTSFDTIEQFRAVFAHHREIGSVPVETSDGQMQIVPRESLSQRSTAAWMPFFSRPLARYLSTDYGTLDARDHLEAVLAAQYAGDHEPQRHYVVFHRGRYFGVVDLSEILRAVFRLRSQEMERAREIQQHLLRPTQWDNAPYEVHTYLDMAYQLGGDFYYRKAVDERHEIVACFDVSGKNISAALSTSLIASFFSTLEVADRLKHIEPTELIAHANSVLYRQTPADMFVAAIVVFIDLERRAVRVFNHGYSPLVVYRRNGPDAPPPVETIEPQFAPLGIEETIDLDGAVDIDLGTGSRVFSYSDGLPDAQDPAGSPFGDERVVELVHRNAHLEGEAFIDALRREIRDFIGDAPRTDDITAILLTFDDSP